MDELKHGFRYWVAVALSMPAFLILLAASYIGGDSYNVWIARLIIRKHMPEIVNLMQEVVKKISDARRMHEQI